MPSPSPKQSNNNIEASPKSSNNSSSSAPQSPAIASNMLTIMPRTHQSCHTGQKDGPHVPGHVNILPKPEHHVAGPSSEFRNNNDDLALSEQHHPSSSSHLTSSTNSSPPRIPSTQTSKRGVVQYTSTAITSPVAGSPSAPVRPLASVSQSTRAFPSPRTKPHETVNKRMSVEKLIPETVASPTPNKKKRKRTSQKLPGTSTGRWTREEHQAFLEGLKECGREWKKVAQRIPTRTSAQIRSHAQKYFAKLQREQEALVVDHHHPTAAVFSDGSSRPITPSVQRNIDRILANPTAAQQEVETTMQALRERYRQLQLRLEQRRRQRHQASQATGNPSRFVEPEDVKQGDSHDDVSSVSSTVSSAVASLANEELIALRVLGGSLSRGEAGSTEAPTEEVDKKEEQLSSSE